MNVGTIAILAVCGIAGFAVVWMMMSPYRPPGDGDDPPPG